MISRCVAFIVVLVSLIYIIRLIAHQPADVRLRLAPRAVLVFCAFWLSVLLATITGLLLTECQTPPATWVATVLGAASVWSIGGLTWLVVVGNITAQRRARTYEESKLDKTDIIASVIEQSTSEELRTLAREVVPDETDDPE